VISSDVELGKGVLIFQPDLVNLYGCSIGENTKIGAFVEIQRGARVGRFCKISSHSFICTGVIIEDGVFIGHGVIFTNDRYPRSLGPDGRMQREGDWQLIGSRVCAGASIGSNATICPGVTIGEASMVGAGAVVTRDVPPNVVAVGVPAQVIRTLAG
jgi:acetyltransferase-like isoleucine patch superfamily enzyme